VRPVFNPALPRTWRAADTIQFGLEPARAVMLTGVDEPVRRLFDLLDGTRPLDEVLRTAEDAGLAPAEARRILTLLDRAGAIQDASARAVALAGYPRPDRDRLAPDVSALAVAGVQPERALRRRGRSHVRVVGLGRPGAGLAALLAASGVGTISGEDDRKVRPADTGPAGFRREDAGRRRLAAFGDLLRSVTGHPASAAGDGPADLVALVDRPDPDPSLSLVRDGIPHLVLRAEAGLGEVGPLVLPGRSACGRCLDLSRADRDRQWPAVAARRWREEAVVGCDLPLSHLVAGLAAREILAFLDGRTPATVDGTLTLSAGGWQVRRRSWARHPDCGCSWAGPAPEGGQLEDPPVG
jgi:bacteriocin biosynthesis cyclodehydratase domain-containing protein